MTFSIKSKPELQEENKMNTFSVTGNALLDLAIFKLLNVNFIAEIDLFLMNWIDKFKKYFITSPENRRFLEVDSYKTERSCIPVT